MSKLALIRAETVLPLSPTLIAALIQPVIGAAAIVPMAFQIGSFT